MKWYLWPSWHGALIRWRTIPRERRYGGGEWYRFKLVFFRKCSHDTARQVRINWWRWSWYIVLRNREVTWYVPSPDIWKATEG